MVIMIGAAGWYTSRSEFCNSCHIMEPYYKSWQNRATRTWPASNATLRPGFGGKIRGKMLGLVQLAKYVTKSAGPRPGGRGARRQLPALGLPRDAACSPAASIYSGIHFDHRPHMGEIRRGKQLRCTSCHSQIVQGKHMAVTDSTCFLCHFKDEPFNEGLAACTHCHQIPDEGIRSGRRRQVHPRTGLQEGRRLHQLPRRRDPRRGKSAPGALPDVSQSARRPAATWQ